MFMIQHLNNGKGINTFHLDIQSEDLEIEQTEEIW